MKESNIEQREDGLYEKSSGRKIVSPLKMKCHFCEENADRSFTLFRGGITAHKDGDYWHSTPLGPVFFVCPQHRVNFSECTLEGSEIITEDESP